MDPLKKKKKYLDSYAKYSSIGFQMLAIILIGVFGGVKLDQWLELKAPVFTVILSILSVILAIYYAVKDLIRLDKKDKKKNSDNV
jgi:F0F1-type ATP synthase assembly protein I